METTSRNEMVLGEVINQLRAQQLWQLPDTDLTTFLSQLGSLRHYTDVLLGDTAREVAERGTFKEFGYTSPAMMLANTSPLTITQATAVTKLSNRLTRLAGLKKAYEPVRDAYHDSLLAGPHAELIAKFLEKYCNRIPEHAENTVVATLVAFGADPDSQQLKNTITTLQDSMDTENGAPPPGEDRDLDELHISRTLRGRVKIDGDLNKLCGEMLLELMDALDVQQTGDEGTTRARSRAQLRADAFEELLRRALESARLPHKAGRRPNVGVTVDAEAFTDDGDEQPGLFDDIDDFDDDDWTEDDADETDVDDAGTDEGDVCDCDDHDGGEGEPGDGEPEPEPEVDGGCCGHDQGRAGVRRGKRDKKRGRRPRRRKSNRFTVSFDAGLQAAIERKLKLAGKMPWGGAITIELVRMIACDASITPILTKNGKPIDMGRATRYATAVLREYLALRDGGCAFPGCRRPASWCDAHHIQWWSDGGRTDHENLVLLCRHHHTLVHQSKWEIRMGADEVPLFIPPAKLDPYRKPIPAAGRGQPRAA